MYTNYVQVHKCEKNFHTYKKLQAEITEKFKNFEVEIKKNFKKQIRSFEAENENILRSLSLNPILRLLIEKNQCRTSGGF